MRVIASGNLTIELIRAQRFDATHRAESLPGQSPQQPDGNALQRKNDYPRVDKVQLSPKALESDPWALPSDRTNQALANGVPVDHLACSQDKRLAPERLSPVVGSPALAGLGAAWVVPGTLLDVVA